MCERVRRKEDMSPDGFLEVFVDTDNNDIHVSVFSDDRCGDTVYASVEFCCVGFGGGQSPRTREALRNLAEAMRLDNEEKPGRAVKM